MNINNDVQFLRLFKKLLFLLYLTYTTPFIYAVLPLIFIHTYISLHTAVIDNNHNIAYNLCVNYIMFISRTLNEQ